MKKSLTVGILVILLIVSGITFKRENIIDTCSLTGASQRYTRYFSIITTEPKIQTYWVDDILIANDCPIPNRKWVRTSETITQLFRSRHVNYTVPIIYPIHYLKINDLKSDYTDEQIFELALKISSGNSTKQKEVVARITSCKDF